MEKSFNIMANWNNCTVSYFFDTKVFSLFDLKKSVYFLLILLLQTCFLDSPYTLTEVVFRMNEIHYSESCFVELSTRKKNLQVFVFVFIVIYMYEKSETKERLTGEMHTKNSLFRNPKLTCLLRTFKKILLFVFYKMLF